MRQARDPADDDYQEEHEAANKQPGRDLAFSVMSHVSSPLGTQAGMRIVHTGAILPPVIGEWWRR